MTRARNSANLASHGNLFVDITNDRTGIGSVVPAQNLHVAGTAGFHADVTFTGDLYNTTWDRSANTLKFNDSALLRFGTGNDANIRHDGSNTWIQNTTGYLYIDGNGDGIRLISHAHWQAGAMAAFYKDGGVVLYHDANQKFSTTAYGTNITGTTDTDGLIVSGVATVTTMNVTGVLTYDDVTSVDSIGIVTARAGLNVSGGNVTIANDIDVDGHTELDNVRIVGMATASSVTVSGNQILGHGNSTGNQIKFTRSGLGDELVIGTDGYGSSTQYEAVIQSSIVTARPLVFRTNNTERLRIAGGGTVTFSGDLNVAENIIHTGDTDTKISFPGPNQITLESGGNRGLYVDPNGNLVKAASGGVGNASVYARDLFISGSGYRGITLHTTSTSGTRGGCIFFGEGTSVPDMASGIFLFDHNSNHFHFSTGGSTNVGKSLRINSVGDVRFDSTPTSAHAMSVVIKSHKSRVLDDNNGICFLDGVDHTQAVINVQKKSTSNASSDLVFRTSGGQVVNTLQGIPERLRITSNGNVLVNQTSEFGSAVKLSVRGASSAISDGGQIFDITTTASATGGTRLSFGVNEDNYAWIRSYESGVGSRALVFSGVSEYGRFTSDGKLIVGATAPTNGSIAEFSKSVAGGGAGCHITVENTSTNSVNNTAGIHLKTDTGTAKFFKYRAAQTFIQSASGGASELLLQANGAHPMRLYAGDAERVRIEDTGEVYFYGNQTSVPEGDFGFRWDRNSSVDFTIKNTNNTSVNAGARIKLIAHIGNIAMHYVNNGGFYLNNSASGYLHYYSGGTSRLYIDTSGNVNINNAGTIATSNGGVGKRLGIKSNANNIFIGETESASNFGLILESRVSGRSGDARASQIGLGNGVIDFYTAASGAGVTKRMEIASGGDVNITGGNLHVGTDGATANFTDSGGGNTKHIEIGATGGGDALLTTHASGYGIGYFGYHTGMDRLVVACDQGGGNNSIDFVTTAGTSTGGSTDNLHNKNPRFRIQGNGGFRAEFTDSNEVHAISNYDHGNQAYTHRGGRTLTSNGAGWDGNESSDGADPILVLSVADRAGNSDIGDAYGIQLHSESQDNNDYGPLIGWTNRSNSGNYNTTYAAIVGQKTGQATDTNWSSGSLHFFTNKPGAGSYMDNTADLTIDSVGRISTPRQPSFLAEHGHNSGNHKQKSEIYMSFIRNFQHVRHNTGNCFNNSTGKFTAPIAGIYLFHIDFTMDGGAGSDDSAGCYFRVENNSANYNRTHSGVRDFHSVDPNLHSTSTGYEVNASFHTIEKLAAGATCGFYFTDWDATNTRITTCFFSGYKVG